MPRVWPSPPAITVYDDVLGDVPKNEVRTGLPVKSVGQWADFAKVTNWLLGRGVQQQCIGPQMGLLHTTSIGPGETKYYGWFLLSYDVTQDHNYMVSICLRLSARGTAFGQFLDIDDNQVGAWSLGPQDYAAGKIFRFLVPAPGYQSMAVQVVHEDPGEPYEPPDVLLAGLQCFEIPHVQIPATTLAYVTESSLDQRQEIFKEDAADNQSLDAIFASLPTAESTSRRAYLYTLNNVVSDVTDYATDVVQYTTTTYPSSEQAHTYAVIQPRNLRGGGDSDEVTLSWLAVVGAVGTVGQTAEFRIRTYDTVGAVATDTVTQTVTVITGNYPTVYTGTIQCRAEDVNNLTIDPGDVTVGGGWPGGTGGEPDVIELNLKTVTATSVYVGYFTIYEEY